MIDFVQDDERLRDERKKAKKNKDKYVGMSSESTSGSGFRSKGFGGFETGSGGGGSGGGNGSWKDDWNRSNSNPSGFRDHSDDDGSRGPSPDVAEFRDEDHDYSPTSSNTSKKGQFSDSVTATATPPTLSSLSSSRPSTATSSKSGAVQSKNKPVKKPIDLGAAANLAQQGNSKSNHVQKQQPTSQIDLFGVSEELPVSSRTGSAVSKSVNLFDDDEEEDDFNPRQTASGSDSANANGDFGNFESAFGETGKSKTNNGGSGTDSFADFSSAFGAGGIVSGGGGPSSLPAPPTPPPGSNFDLMAGPSSTPATSGASGSSSSNFDLLGGLVMSTGVQPQQPPPLVGFGGHQNSFPPTAASAAAPQSMPTNLFQNMPPVQMPPGSGMGQPISLMTAMNNKSNNNHNATSASVTSMNKKATMWDNVGNVNIDLDNLSLKGGNNKKSGLPMNSLITPTASPQRVGSVGLGMAPPPLKPVQGGKSATSGGGSLDLGDLLN